MQPTPKTQHSYSTNFKIKLIKLCIKLIPFEKED
jgi:hypothetical protein